MPEGTINAFLDHGTVRRTVDDDVEGARRTIEQVEAAGISMEAVTAKLETDGVKSFSDSFDSLISTLAKSMEDQRARGAA
jgi:transaldolase